MEYLTRELKVSTRILDQEKRECEFVGATETPVDMGDGGPPEVLRMSGAEFRQQIPFLNAHSRRSVLDVLGRSTSILVDPDKRALIFNVRFSKATDASRAAWELVRDGSIDSVSIGYQVKKFRELRAGEYDGWGAGRVEGPATIATKWVARELSLVPIGADPNARKRAYAEALKEEYVTLKPKTGETRDQWIARAMVDAEVAGEFADEVKRRAFVAATWDLAVPLEGRPPVSDVEARKRLILSRCPDDLRVYCEEMLLKEPLIAPETAWVFLREERARRLQADGANELDRLIRGDDSYYSRAQAIPTSSRVAEPSELGRVIREYRSVSP